MKKISKILSDDPSRNINEFDIFFLIDATGSMSPYIEAAKLEAKNISNEFKKLYPAVNFQYGYIFYRDPVDSKNDIHEIINLTDNVNSLPEQINKIRAYGGGDTPEDWAGGYRKLNNEIKWRNGKKIIIHITDTGAHGKRFTLNDKYPEEEQKLYDELDRCAANNIKIFGYMIKEECRNSFDECKIYYQKKGQPFEVFKFPNNNNINQNNPNPFISSNYPFINKNNEFMNKPKILYNSYMPINNYNNNLPFNNSNNLNSFLNSYNNNNYCNFNCNNGNLPPNPINYNNNNMNFSCPFINNINKNINNINNIDNSQNPISDSFKSIVIDSVKSIMESDK